MVFYVEMSTIDMICDRGAIAYINEVIGSLEEELRIDLEFLDESSEVFALASVDLTPMVEHACPILMEVNITHVYHVYIKCYHEIHIIRNWRS
jgi:hypothetical protein